MTSHQSTIPLVAESIVKLGELLEVPHSDFMVVIPKRYWKEFVNRANLDARGMMTSAPLVPTEHTPKWVKILDVYFVSGT